MVVVRGVNLYPSAVEEIIRSAGGVAEYQVTVSQAHAMTELSVEIEPSGECADSAALVQKLETAFDAALNLRVPVKVVASGALPRSELKANRWVRQ